MRQNDHFKFSVTVHCADRNLIGCLSIHAWLCEPENPRRIHIAGEEGDEWEHNGHNASFHFTREANRRTFIDESQTLFKQSLKITDQRDDDPPRG